MTPWDKVQADRARAPSGAVYGALRQGSLVLVESPLHPLAIPDQEGEEIRLDGVLTLYQHTPADVAVGSDLSDLWKYVEIEQVRLFEWQPKTCRTFGSLSGVHRLLLSCSHVESVGRIFEKVPKFLSEPVRKCPCGLEALTVS